MVSMARQVFKLIGSIRIDHSVLYDVGVTSNVLYVPVKKVFAIQGQWCELNVDRGSNFFQSRLLKCRVVDA